MAGRVPPAMLAKDTSSASSTGVKDQPSRTGPAKVSSRPVARRTAATIRSFWLFGSNDSAVATPAAARTTGTATAAYSQRLAIGTPGSTAPI